MNKTKIIETKTGNLQGSIERDIHVFKGIPYAEPPIGDSRLNVPIAKRPWSGVMEALKFGPEALQPYNINTPRPYPEQSEGDCLTLNIWTPGIDNKKRAVLFWIHGGSFMYGSGTRVIYYGTNMATKGDVVVVTINYRLGPFANLHFSDADPNVGMLDQIVALEWVNKNIELFGGDPNNITIFGESAGAAAVCTLMAMPKAKGLFKRGIPQSGAAHPLGFTKTGLRQTTELLLNELKIKTDDLEKFRKIPAVDIIKATHRLQQRNFTKGIRLRFGPYVDGEILPQHPLKAINEGYAKDVDLIIGTNFEESKFWHMFYPNFEETKAEDLPKRMKNALKMTGENEEDLENVLTTYQDSREENGLSSSPQDILDAYNTDQMFRIPAVRFADAQSKHQKNTYMYLFSWGLPNTYGAMHGLEIGFVFNRFFNVDVPTLPKKTEETEKLSENMMNSWISFAKKGDPNHSNIPKWPQYDNQERNTIVFDKNIKIWNNPLSREREMWNTMNLLSRF